MHPYTASVSGALAPACGLNLSKHSRLGGNADLVKRFLLCTLPLALVHVGQWWIGRRLAHAPFIAAISPMLDADEFGS